MKKTTSLLITMGLMVMAKTPVAYSQFIDTSAVNKVTVAQILKDPKDDEWVVLQGYLIKKVSSEKYIFKSANNEIRVEIDEKVFPAQPFDASVLIEIAGEVDKDFLQSPEIDVKRLMLVN